MGFTCITGKRKTRLQHLLPVVVLILAGLLATPASARAASLNPLDYFSYSYNVSITGSYIQQGEIFYGTASGEAVCIKDAPVHPTEAYIKGRVIAEHLQSGMRFALNSSYPVTITPVPSIAGERISTSQEVPLYFPWDGPAGEYLVSAELIEARFKAGGLWFDVTDLFPQSQAIGNLFYRLSAPITTPPVTKPPVTTTTVPITTTPAPPTTSNTPITPPVTPPTTPPVTPPVTTSLPPQTTITPPVTTPPPVPAGATALGDYIDSAGRVAEAFSICSADGQACLYFDMDSWIILEGQAPPAWLMIMPVDAAPPGQETDLVGLAYQVLPENAVFGNGSLLKLHYYQAGVPAGMQEGQLALALWDDDNSAWVELENSRVDAAANTVSAPVYSAGVYAIVAPVSPARFVVSGLSISPVEAACGEMVSISCMVTNSGLSAGYYQVVLELNGQLHEVKRISLAGETSMQVSFGVVRNAPGSYSVEINGLKGSYTVTEEQHSVTYTPTKPPQEYPPENPFYWLWVIYAVNALLLLVVIYLCRQFLARQFTRFAKAIKGLFIKG